MGAKFYLNKEQMKKNKQSPMTSFEELAQSDAVKSMGFEYDFRPTGYPDLDAINGLIRLADRYAKEGNIEKANELSNRAQEYLDKIKSKVLTKNKE